MTVIATGAGIAFGLALVLLATFFRTQDSRFDRVAEWCFVVFAALGIPVILAVGDRLGGAGGAVMTGATAGGALGAGVLGLAELGSSLRLVDFRRIAAITTLGFVAFLVWIGAVSIATIAAQAPVLPVALGWLGIASIGAGLVIIGWIMRTPGVVTGDAEPPALAMAAFFVPMAGIVAWMVGLGLSL
jgi:hypothetical protein